MNSKVALIIIYNHRYDRNIDILEGIYAGRFSNIFHIIPFYDGDKKNVIAVYENSYRFQGYISQAFKTFFNESFEHYFFIADDMVINPSINEYSYQEQLKLKPGTSYFPEFISLNDGTLKWLRFRDAIEYKHFVPGVEFTKELPSYDQANEILAKAGFNIKPLLYKDVYPQHMQFGLKEYLNSRKSSFSSGFKILAVNSLNKAKSGIHIARNRSFKLNYPMVGGYSDIFIISSTCIKKFVHYCGVFAASEMFVELAIPTALLFSTDDIRKESEVELKGKAMWTAEDFEIVAPFNNNLDDLMKEFPSNHLYLHPIKLSKWKTNLQKSL
jgi:hypothetical protein